MYTDVQSTGNTILRARLISVHGETSWLQKTDVCGWVKACERDTVISLVVKLRNVLA